MQWQQLMLFLTLIILSWRSHRNSSRHFCQLMQIRNTHSLLTVRKWTWQKSAWRMRCARSWQPIRNCWLLMSQRQNWVTHSCLIWRCGARRRLLKAA
ncbi:hypothetical protein BX54_00430 [Escherichia coli O121:H19 str. 2010C-3840]|nr:hypothetical protein BX62_03315 [Escherichia coli O121:H19 str. 2010C-4254]EYV03085.1 hypothetical protein BX54_00430 [Escherichia coli O121:H19 str. 2010C-3840]EYV03624.1 hypothetical protein BX52_03095 [Escherichia coli O121:H19 str. 2010C-3609]EYV11888.1 hypothetical protein BX51_18490 [Escherichia coli O145:NM str. 2010C-3526]EYV21758.1 hypothetical protein BX48_10615 [Escherichia coli O145:NM str. 2010C-3517]EYV22694.1 hypothetical protein BX49_24390 [Escherichia coli O145:NM str. 2010